MASPERGERLVVVDVCGRDGGDHGRLGVAPEVLPEEPRQHGVAVRDEVRLLLLPAGARGRRRRGLEISGRYHAIIQFQEIQEDPNFNLH